MSLLAWNRPVVDKSIKQLLTSSIENHCRQLDIYWKTNMKLNKAGIFDI